MFDVIVRELFAARTERDALIETVRATLTALESGAFFDWYARDVILRRLRAHVEKKEDERCQDKDETKPSGSEPRKP
jgi:hypothetical protein